MKICFLVRLCFVRFERFFSFVCLFVGVFVFLRGEEDMNMGEKSLPNSIVQVDVVGKFKEG